ncbi:MAG: hypothetical protein ACFBSE_06860 [Prochloraceae cyanobacterium]
MLAEFLLWASRYRRLTPLQGLMTILYLGGYAFIHAPEWMDLSVSYKIRYLCYKS